MNVNVKVKEFILTNNDPLVSWRIDGDFYRSRKYIPEYLLDKYVFDWGVDFWDARIEITTEYHT
jgi:hypothetical protein